MEKNSKIYVAGHTGLTGSAIVRRLTSDGYSNLLLRTRAELDLFDRAAVLKFFKENQPEYVILCAAKVGGIMANMSFPVEFLSENLTIQNNIIGAAHEFPPKKLLFLSSTCVYPVNSPQSMKEEYLFQGPPEPSNEAYAIAKIAGMKLCEYMQKEFNHDFISCVPTNLYGPNDNLDPQKSHVIPALMGRMHKAKLEGASEFTVWGDGTPRREFLYIDDFADAILWIMNSYAGKEFLNVGTGEDISIGELVEILKKVIGYEGTLVYDTSKPNGIPKKLSDVSRIHALGWKHSTLLHDGLSKMYEWFKNEHDA